MKHILMLATLFLAACSGGSSSAGSPAAALPIVSPSAAPQLALVYDGPGVCQGCPEAAGAAAARLGLRVQYVVPSQMTTSLLQSASVFIVGGGTDAQVIMSALGGAAQTLKTYVANGGRYWGICAGAYLAGASVDSAGVVSGLQLFPGDTAPYSGVASRVESVSWNGVSRWLYIQEAPKFVLNPQSNVSIIATYGDGSIAAITAAYGRGWVSLSGPHPEAPTDWLTADQLSNPGIASPDLGDQMLRDLLAKN